MILPKLSAAILSMGLLGSAYAAPSLTPNTSLDQWVVILGAANGAASLLGANTQDIRQHRHTAFTHLTRYASEHGVELDQFDGLFERGITEGQKLLELRAKLIVPEQNLIRGFQHDKSIRYESVLKAVNA